MWFTTSAFKAAIIAPVHAFVVRAQVLDADFNVVEGGTFYDTGSEQYIQNYIADGSVDADISRNTRRTLSLSLLNQNAEFSPNSSWTGLFYVNRLVRVWRGVRFASGEEEYVPVGTFMLDAADVVAERNMSVVSLTGSDLWKKMAKAKLGVPMKYSSGTAVQDVIKDLATRAGVTRFVIDPLSSRSSNTRNIQADLNYERNAVIGDEISKLATAWGLDIYFDPMGRLVSEDSRLSRSPVWAFQSSEQTSLLTVKASFTDEGLYNHILVTGTADQSNPVYAEALDTDPTSPTYYQRIGKRTFMYESTFIKTAEQAQLTADKLLRDHMSVTEAIELQSICIPSFEGNDVVTIKEPEFTKVDLRLRVRSYNVPLSSSRQTIKLQREVNIA